MITIKKRSNAPSTKLFVDVVNKKNKVDIDSAPLFILPGGPGANCSHFSSYKCLQDSVNMVFFDPRGCGRSDKGKQADYSINNYIDDIEEIRQSLGINKISLLGLSYSGLCALGYAIRYPESTEKLILVASGPSHHFIETAKSKLVKIGTKEQIAASNKLWKGSFTTSEEVEKYFDLMTPLYSCKKLSNEKNVTQNIEPFAVEPLNRGFQTDLRTVDFIDKLENIRCETLIMTGDKDWIFDQCYSKLMAEKIPKSKLIIFKNTGHFIESDAKNDYFSNIKSFIN